MSIGVKGWACWVLGGQGVGLQGHRGSRGGPTGSQGVKGRPTGSQVPGCQGVGQKGPKGSRGRPTHTIKRPKFCGGGGD